MDLPANQALILVLYQNRFGLEAVFLYLSEVYFWTSIYNFIRYFRSVM